MAKKTKPTEFEEKVYAACKQVPRGKVTTYKALAEKLGTKAYRAVGQALRKNPYSVWWRVGGHSRRRQRDIVPCHRVVCSDGSVGGFMGKKSGKNVNKKIALLRKEGVEVDKGKVISRKNII